MFDVVLNMPTWVTWIHLKLPQTYLQLFNTTEFPANIYLFKVRNTRKKMWSMLKVKNKNTWKVLWRSSGIFIVDFEVDLWDKCKLVYTINIYGYL